MKPSALLLRVREGSVTAEGRKELAAWTPPRGEPRLRPSPADRRNAGDGTRYLSSGWHDLQWYPAAAKTAQSAIRRRGRLWDLFARPSRRGKVLRAMSR